MNYKWIRTGLQYPQDNNQLRASSKLTFLWTRTIRITHSFLKLRAVK